MLNEPSILKAAHAAGVGERTLHKWLDTDDEFIAAYRQARRQTFTQAIGLTMRYIHPGGGFQVVGATRCGPPEYI